MKSPKFGRRTRFFVVNYFLSFEASLVCVHELPIRSLHVGSTTSPRNNGFPKGTWRGSSPT
jgi:hypothetical protein